ncbi:hypothetical protein [Sphingomonas sanguinis]|uniref:hypothetical protein n=1 Tax=Sphingomonas sanguinis TaxID=33051 RepID=UPI00214B1C1F|nr:hypothetical protein [Sphingomonas sanguinis]
MTVTVTKRPTVSTHTATAGCVTCHGQGTGWTGANALALAARHHDATGHATWCDTHLSVRYGNAQLDARQIDIEDAIREADHG